MKGKPTRHTARIRALIDNSTGEIVEAIIRDAKNNDLGSRQLFVRYLMRPRGRYVAEPIDLKPAQSAAQAREQIGVLTSMAAKGELDLDTLHALSRALQMAISTRIEELEELLEEREAQDPDAR